MNLEEAKLKVQVTPEERDSVEKYLQSSHSIMNALIGFSVTKYIESANQGWNLPGIHKDKSKEIVGEEILEAIENAANVYSVMVKTMHENSAPRRLMRGTSNDEARRLHQGGRYDRIVSASTNEITAKAFGRNGNAAFLRIIAQEDVPFIDVENFIGKENLSRDESEYILAPFTEVKSSIFRSDWNGFKYYDVVLGKPEMREFKEGEKTALQSEIKSKFTDMLEKGKEVISLQCRYGCLLEKKGGDAEDRAYIAKDKQETLDKIYELKKELEAFEVSVGKYIEGIFVEREKEFKIAYDINKTEESRIIEEQKKIKQEENIREQQKAFREMKTKFYGIMDRAPTTFTEQYHALKDEEIKYYNMAKILRNSI